MLNEWKNQPAKDRIIVALDCEADKALAISYALRNRAKWVKVGMTLYYAYGDDLVKILKQRGFNVFLDLKFLDIPHQVRGAAKSATLSGADMLTMHAMGGADMIKAANEGALEAGSAPGINKPATLAITVLTSMNEQTLKSVGVENPLEAQVKHLAQLALDNGTSGVVASPIEAKMLRAQLGKDALIVCPGVRPKGSSAADQSRIATPKEAFDAGASHIVIGRPIANAADPVAAFDEIAASF